MARLPAIGGARQTVDRSIVVIAHSNRALGLRDAEQVIGGAGRVVCSRRKL